MVMREDEVEDLLDELERLRFVESVKAALASLDRGEGISLEDLEARFEAEEAALLAREADRAD